MGLYEKLLQKETSLSVIGLGYVGLPLAIAFAKKINVIGYDSNADKVNLYRQGKDSTREAGDVAVASTTVQFTDDPIRLKEARFHIVAVPTPIHADHTPLLSPIREASRILGENLSIGSVVVYESTVYPGVTEEVCVPILEQSSGLKCGRDFKIGYSPERINPGDSINRLETIVKIVSGMDAETLETVARIYSLVVAAGVYRAASIKVAEAAKVIENSQRDVNIAFMNEISMIFHRMGIDTREVLEAAGTKWNFLKFYPGLVGGHCIGIDPYYLTYKAEMMGYHSQIILAGRRVNDGMARYVVESLIKLFIRNEVSVKGARVAIFGITFKENCPDTRNSKAIELYYELVEYGVVPVVVDPVADVDEVERAYSLALDETEGVRNVNAIIVAVAHEKFIAYEEEDLIPFYKVDDATKILFDVKGIYNKKKCEKLGFIYWSL